MKVLVLPLYVFKDDVAPKKSTLDETTCFISILDPDGESLPFHPDSDNYMTLSFYDLEEPVENYEIFTSEMARKIIKFVEANKEKKHCVVHCTLGVARSGAVGEFINDILKGESYREFKKRNPAIIPNVLVKTILNNEYYGKRK